MDKILSSQSLVRDLRSRTLQLLSLCTTTREPTRTAVREAQALQPDPAPPKGKKKQTSGSFEGKKLAGVSIHSLRRLWWGAALFLGPPWYLSYAGESSWNCFLCFLLAGEPLLGVHRQQNDHMSTLLPVFFQDLASVDTSHLWTSQSLLSPGYDCVFIFINFIL